MIANNFETIIKPYLQGNNAAVTEEVDVRQYASPTEPETIGTTC